MGKGEGGMGAECGAGDDGGDLLLGALGDTKWWPPGFRFHPTDEELVLYYLKRKVCRRRIRLPTIGDVDVYKWEPWELPEKSVLRSGDKQWYFFSPRDRKYPNGSRSNRSTESGYWKATGKDRTISQNKSMAVGNKKTLVYYRGRPPRGERTDWVMHEYTLDEQVLMRCNNVQDSYALYKVFRKSGPGPKNGEEYGAPFREEEWNDNEDPDDCLRNQGDTIDLLCDHPHSNSVAEPMLGNDRSTVPIDDLEDFLLQMSSEQVTTQRHTLGLPDIDVAVEVGSHTLGPPYIDDATSTKQNGAWCDQFSTVTSFHVPPHTCVYTQLIAVPDVESPLTNYSEQGHLETSGEFLEIKDFNDPDPTVWSINDISHKDHIPDADEFFDPYDYFDANMYLAEAMEPLDGIMASGAHLDGFDDNETHNQASHMISELWTHEQPLSASAAVELEQVAMAAPASGAVWDSSSLVNLGGGGPQGEINHAGSESNSWFNSALAAFLETIPSSPAMASENALLSRALERVSSFKAGRLGARDHHPDTTTAGGGAVAGRRQGDHNRGLLFLSFLVGLGAALWVLIIGASVKALKCLWGRYSTS